MAVGRGTSIGTPGSANPATTSVAITTNVTIPSASFIVLLVSCFNAGAGAATITVAGGSLTWTQDVVAANGNDRIAIFRTYATSGLATSTTITATFSVAQGGRAIGGFYYSGITPTSPLDATNSASPATGTAWNGGAVTAADGGLVIGNGVGDGAASTSTPTAGYAEALDFNLAAAVETWTMVDQGGSTVLTAGSYTPGGTFAVSETTIVGVSAAYEAAAAVAPNLVMAPFQGAF